MPAMPQDVVEIEFPDADRSAVSSSIDRLVTRYGRADDPDFLRAVGGLGELLPPAVLRPVLDLRYRETAAALVVRNGPIADDPGPTPAHWSERAPEATLRYDFWLALVLAQLGDPVGWLHLQDGRLFNDLLPIRDEEHEQTAHGSKVELEYHVEEAFQDDRSPAFALLCLRNDDGVPTTIATAGQLDLAALNLDVLFEPRFRITAGPDLVRVRPVLFGSQESPYLRVDPIYTEALPGDSVAQAAFDALCEQLGTALGDVVLGPGDLLLVDNYRVVHGRRPFTARFDGSDRWLRRLSVVRDLRPTRVLRRGVDDRVVTY